MKRLSQFTIAFVLLVMSSAGLSAQASHTTFTGGIFFQSPCNGEIVVGPGPVKIVYARDESGRATIHSTLRVQTYGDLGNPYVISFVTNATFDAPSGGGEGYVYYDAPVSGEVVATGSAADFSWSLYNRLYVVNDVVVGSVFIGPSTTACRGV